LHKDANSSALENQPLMAANPSQHKFYFFIAAASMPEKQNIFSK